MVFVMMEVKFSNQEEKRTFKNEGEQELAIVRGQENRLLKKHLGKWDWACLYVDGTLKHYYHPTEGVQPITCKKLYTKLLNEDKVNLFIIYKNGHTKTIRGSRIEDMPKYYNQYVGEVRAYKNNQVIAKYKNGRLFKV